jgi:hypothetical protein
MSSKFRNFMRFLNKNPYEANKIKSLNDHYNQTSNYMDAKDCMASLHMIYLKKLSTGHDEDQQHQK